MHGYGRNNALFKLTHLLSYPQSIASKKDFLYIFRGLTILGNIECKLMFLGTYNSYRYIKGAESSLYTLSYRLFSESIQIYE